MLSLLGLSPTPEAANSFGAIVEFQVISNTNELNEAFYVMQELRPHLDKETFLNLFQIAQTESGYSLMGAYYRQRCIGLIGYRVLTDFVHGRHLYIDDLVISDSHQSQGIGTQLLSKAKEIAAVNCCRRIRLCTGTENKRGMGFYKKNGWKLKAVVYKISL